MVTRIEFLASLPDIQSACKIGQNSMRVQLDIPATELTKALPLAVASGRILKITIEWEDSNNGNGRRTN